MNLHSTLSATQQETQCQLLSLVTENAGKPTIILLTGIGGTGKSLLLDQSKEKIEELGGTAIDIFDLLGHEKTQPRKSIMAAFHDPKANKVLVAPSTPRENKRILERLEEHLSGWSAISCVLKGMSREETKKYISAKIPEGTKLSLDELTNFSLGIPLLADQLITLDLDKEQALRFSLLFLIEKSAWTNDPEKARGMMNTYLDLEIPPGYIAAFCDPPDMGYFGRHTRIYDNLPYFMDSEQGSHRKIGTRPIFVDSLSETIYNSMLATPDAPWIEIYAPSMTDDQALAIYDVLGIDHDDWDGAISARAGYNGKEPLLAYRASYRKVSFYVMDGHGHESSWLNEAEDLDIIARFLHAQITEAKIPIPAENPKGHRILVHSHDHYDEPHNPTQIGWAVETLFQNLGISYFVNNFVYGKQYVYNAETKRVKILGEAKRVDTLELKYPEIKKKKHR